MSTYESPQPPILETERKTATFSIRQIETGISGVRCMRSMGFSGYSYLSASTGLSFEARQAGYSAKIMLTPKPKASAPKNTVGVSKGVMLMLPEVAA